MTYEITLINEKDKDHDIRRSSAICIETGVEVRVFKIPEDVKVGSVVTVTNMGGPKNTTGGIVIYNYDKTIKL